MPYSKEKVTDDSKKKKEKRETEWWPLIRVVRIYTKADALSTGAVIVDLPGVHDSNAARAAVAAGKQDLLLATYLGKLGRCPCFWLVDRCSLRRVP
jgi:hypothetical protein